MIALLADEGFNGHVVEGVRRRMPGADLLTCADAGLLGLKDPELLEAAARQGRIMLTHDVRTMIGDAMNRLSLNLPMPGILVANKGLTRARSIEAILFVLELGEPGDFDRLIQYLPI